VLATLRNEVGKLIIPTASSTLDVTRIYFRPSTDNAATLPNPAQDFLAVQSPWLG
jgi:hypothetical protein